MYIHQFVNYKKFLSCHIALMIFPGLYIQILEPSFLFLRDIMIISTFFNCFDYTLMI